MHPVTSGLGVRAVILAALLLSCTPFSALAAPTGQVPSVHALERLPLAFEPNAGQAPEEVRYVASGLGYRLWLTERDAVFMAPRATVGRPAPLRLRLVGAAAAPGLAGEDRLPGVARHVVAAPAGPVERTLATFGRVRYRSVYPGIDLVFHGDGRQAEFDFVVAPGAEPRAIAFELAGADDVALDGGDIVARTGSARLRLRRPVVYQEVDGQRVPVAGRFVLQDRRIAFEVGRYDRGRPLVIDPVVTYSTYLGGAGFEDGRAIAVDGASNMYVIAGDAIVKLAADGKTRVYSVVLGDATPEALAVDASGNAYVAVMCPYPRSGQVPSCPFAGSGQPQSQGDLGAWVVKLAPQGQMLLSTSLGGTGTVTPTAIAVDRAGNVYVTAWNVYGGFPTTTTFGTASDFPTIVAAIAADFSRFLYVTGFRTGGDGVLHVSDIAVDGAGAVYLTGRANGRFPVTAGVVQPAPADGAAMAGMIAKLAPGGAQLAYSTFLGNLSTVPNAIAVDGSGNAYVSGHAGPGLPTAGALQPTPAGAADAFVTKLNAGGTALVFSTYLGGGRDDAATGVGLDTAGNVYVAGATDSTDFPQRNALPPEMGAAGSNFVTVLVPAGNAFVYSTYFGDAQSVVSAMTVTPGGTVYLTGGTVSASYPTVSPYQAAPGGQLDAFIARIEPAAASACATGLFLAEYFGNTALGSPATRTVCEGTPSHDWGSGGPAGLPTDNFSARWTGRPSFTAGSYEFTVRADDGVRLFIDGALVIDGWRDQPATTYTATRQLTAGPHEVKLEYYERGGAAVVQLAWKPTGAVSSTCPTGQFRAEYFGNVTLTPPATRTACETAVNHSWGTGGPAGVPTDSFSARWTGRFAFAGGSVTFTARADDGVRVFLDGTLIVDGWRDQAPTTYSATRTVTQGEHEVKVEYYERGGGAVVQVGWSGTAAGVPTLASLTPGRATAGGPAFTLTADGSGFASGTTVLWNGAPRTTAVVSATRVTASIPAADIAAAGAVPVSVRNADGQTSAARTFTIDPSGGATDTIRVFITAPAGGATVRGTVWFTVWIEGAAAGSKSYTLAVGTTTITSTTTSSTGPVSLAWPTSSADNGSRTATVTVRDSAGATGRASVTLTVAN